VINRLSALRGKGLAGLYSWAAKRFVFIPLSLIIVFISLRTGWVGLSGIKLSGHLGLFLNFGRFG
jgi:Protein SOSEKI 2, plant